MATIREKLNLILREDAMGFVVRSRFSQNAEEERASLFHAGRELKNKKNNVIQLRKQGVTLTDPSDIEAEVTTFFKALFNGYHDTSLNNTGSPFIPDNSGLDEMLTDLSSMNIEDSQKLEIDISEDELEFVISKCSTNKSPGLDGLCYEFYKCTWFIISVALSVE